MYTELTMHAIRVTVTADTRKTEIATLHLSQGNSYLEYRKEISKNCSPYIDNPMLLTEHQYYQLGYAGKGEL